MSDDAIDNNPIILASNVIQLKIESEDAEAKLKSEIDKIMKSEEITGLSKTADDIRLEYEIKKEKLAELMIKQDVYEMRTKDGHCIKLMINGEKKKLKVIPKR